ncbi:MULTISPECIES: potassium transporter TrkG [unclassified Facklamia]|uniref:TrkH family potassium uptake protein n=1 Tax=Aerococcaceae TaxID=186827 RepID=UPI0013B5F953|nr:MULTISPECIES: potassium transporter TrkG [unclassified Facklamia]NEW63876.1 TrkH family potassium uptake protein [Facklamia sp. 252]NEW67347.1 TrkH family potassium uptake protein [Facklamia sp. 253]QQD65224.1 TrkH family potassium uptake protein [Aerococcaceae bacterium zg-252]
MRLLLNRLTIPQRLTASFVIVIFCGSILLSLPIFHTGNVGTTYLDHLFTTVSMVCVTGLTVITVADTYNLFGQMLCIVLMQIGGLGLLTLLAASTFYLKQKLSLKDQYTLQSSFSHESNQDLKALLRSIYRFTAIVELGAALLLMIDFIPKYGIFHGAFNAIFIAVSAFCNAGFDNVGSISMQGEVLNPLVNGVLALLIISGSMGFIVWFELIELVKEYWHSKPRVWRLVSRKMTSHTKLVLYSTLILLAMGTVTTWLTELHNPATIQPYAWWQQGMVSFFQSVTMRTAGFSTLDYSLTKPSTNFLYMIQMIIGGAPGGTAGGMKITTAAVLLLIFRSELRGLNGIQFQRRTIHSVIIRQTVSIVIFFFSVLITGYVLLLITQPDLEPFALLFEAFSALATVGVTMNVTTQLSVTGKMIIMLLMFIGRVGPTTVLLSLAIKAKKEVRYANTNVYLG